MIINRGTIGTAHFSECMTYRYELHIPIENSDEILPMGTAVFLMLNPSTATEDTLDPTVSKCCAYARAWGYDRVVIINIFAFRSTDPKNLKTASDPIGSYNHRSINEIASIADLIVCAWGKHGQLNNRGILVARDLIERNIELHCLNVNNDNSPTHPLYQRLNLKPRLWTEAHEYSIKLK